MPSRLSETSMEIDEMEEKKIFGRIHIKLLKLLSGWTVEAILEV